MFWDFCGLQTEFSTFLVILKKKFNFNDLRIYNFPFVKTFEFTRK